jgi:hypothetical protein
MQTPHGGVMRVPGRTYASSYDAEEVSLVPFSDELQANIVMKDRKENKRELNRLVRNNSKPLIMKTLSAPKLKETLMITESPIEGLQTIAC